MSLRDNTERHLFYKDIYKHRGYAYAFLDKQIKKSTPVGETSVLII